MLYDETNSNENLLSSRTSLLDRQITHIKLDRENELGKYYVLTEFLGKGSYGEVVEAIEKQTDKDWAIKIVSKTVGLARIKMLEREITILKMVLHPHVIYLDRILESCTTVYLVFELCESTLSAMLKKRKRFSEEDARRVMIDLASAVAYLHRNDIVHRDLKLQNILVTQNPNNPRDQLYIKVSDFGLSVWRGAVSHPTVLQGACGTLTYMAPELLEDRPYGTPCDIWSMGVIAYFLLTGEHPFYDNKEEPLRESILKAEPDYGKWPLCRTQSHATRLIRAMLMRNPTNRITAVQIEMHLWLQIEPELVPQTSTNKLDYMKLWPSESFVSTKAAAAVKKTSGRAKDRYLTPEEKVRCEQIRRTFGKVTARGVCPEEMRRRRVPRDKIVYVEMDENHNGLILGPDKVQVIITSKIQKGEKTSLLGQDNGRRDPPDDFCVVIDDLRSRQLE